MKTNQLVQAGILVGLSALAAPLPAVAGGLHIHPVFLESDPPPPGSIVGGGDLQAIVEVAARQWERVFRRGPDWDVTIEYEWAPTPGVFYGRAELTEQGGTPIRPTRGLMVFRNTATPDGAFDWFADPTPDNNSHYEHYESVVGDVTTGEPDYLPAGEINVGRVFSTLTGPAAGRIDLLTIATHEIGHVLGLDAFYAGRIEQVAGGTGTGLFITTPLPFPGYFFFVTNGNHIDGFNPLVLMTAEPTAGWRSLISAADALVIAQLTSYPRPDLGEPPDVPHVKAVHCCRLVLGRPAQTTLPVPDIAE